MGEKLIGAKAICEYAFMTEATFIEKVQRAEFPAERTEDNIWEADAAEVDKWLGKKPPKVKKTKAKAKASSKTEAVVDK